MPSVPEERPARRVWSDEGGPLLVEGPVEVALPDGRMARSDRFEVAVCTCHRSRTYPWCDTSHRLRPRVQAQPDPNRSARKGKPDARDA
ncbi:CDGSH iron-sulfur domain-containing protein [Streptomyces sp. YIM 130001]|uniref:CDGSH iron-sulfur domain-containing protein n=1 Tax=Streptomyces sp. YIM 130001 TaxID=2259644 RepID=UPI001F099640|nr:CDGSH iron-sulfur domain-containing protein [Streptomyces sp. YIM 130001]